MTPMPSGPLSDPGADFYSDDYDEDCPDCGGEGDVHDCGEDTCPCADPSTQDRVICSSCNGRGR